MPRSILRPLAAISTALLLAACRNCGPSDRTIRSCILDATGHERLGKAQSNVIMGMEVSRSVIDDIIINNVIEAGDNQWQIHSLITVGARDAHSSDQDNATAAQLFGFEYRNGFLMQDVSVSYLFSEGRNGWSCREM